MCIYWQACPVGTSADQDQQDKDALPTKLAQWLERSGRALELRTARVFWQRNWKVSTSFPYVDEFEPHATREGDVLGDLEWTGLNSSRCLLRVVTECKNTPGKPWVALYGDGNRPSQGLLTDFAVYAHGSHNGIVEPAADWAGLSPFTNAPASHVVTALGDDSHNPANDAVRQALSAAHAIRGQYLASQSSIVSDGPRGWIILAAVVTTSPLYQAHLLPDGTIDIQHVDEVDVWGHASDGSQARVYVRNEKSLPVFLEQLSERVAETAWT